MLTLRNQIGQMLVMGFDGCDIDDQSSIAKWLLSDGLGGVLLFDKDVATGYMPHQTACSQLPLICSSSCCCCC